MWSISSKNLIFNLIRACLLDKFLNVPCTSSIVCLFVFGAAAPQWAMASSFTTFLDHTQRRTTVGRTPLDEWSARRRDLYLTTLNTHNKHPCPGGIRTHDLSKRSAADPRLRPHDHWDRLVIAYILHKLHTPVISFQPTLVITVN